MRGDGQGDEEDMTVQPTRIQSVVHRDRKKHRDQSTGRLHSGRPSSKETTQADVSPSESIKREHAPKFDISDIYKAEDVRKTTDLIRYSQELGNMSQALAQREGNRVVKNRSPMRVAILGTETLGDNIMRSNLSKKVVKATGTGCQRILADSLKKQMPHTERRSYAFWTTKISRQNDMKSECIIEIKKHVFRNRKGPKWVRITLRASQAGCPQNCIISTSQHPSIGFRILEDAWKIALPSEISSDHGEKSPSQSIAFPQPHVQNHVKLTFTGTHNGESFHRINDLSFALEMSEVEQWSNGEVEDAEGYVLEHIHNSRKHSLQPVEDAKSMTEHIQHESSPEEQIYIHSPSDTRSGRDSGLWEDDQHHIYPEVISIHSSKHVNDDYESKEEDFAFETEKHAVLPSEDSDYEDREDEMLDRHTSTMSRSIRSPLFKEMLAEERRKNKELEEQRRLEEIRREHEQALLEEREALRRERETERNRFEQERERQEQERRRNEQTLHEEKEALRREHEAERNRLEREKELQEQEARLHEQALLEERGALLKEHEAERIRFEQEKMEQEHETKRHKQALLEEKDTLHREREAEKKRLEHEKERQELLARHHEIELEKERSLLERLQHEISAKEQALHVKEIEYEVAMVKERAKDRVRKIKKIRAQKNRLKNFLKNQYSNMANSESQEDILGDVVDEVAGLSDQFKQDGNVPEDEQSNDAEDVQNELESQTWIVLDSARLKGHDSNMDENVSTLQNQATTTETASVTETHQHKSKTKHRPRRLSMSKIEELTEREKRLDNADQLSPHNEYHSSRDTPFNSSPKMRHRRKDLRFDTVFDCKTKSDTVRETERVIEKDEVSKHEKEDVLFSLKTALGPITSLELVHDEPNDEHVSRSYSEEALHEHIERQDREDQITAQTRRRFQDLVIREASELASSPDGDVLTYPAPSPPSHQHGKSSNITTISSSPISSSVMRELEQANMPADALLGMLLDLKLQRPEIQLFTNDKHNGISDREELRNLLRLALNKHSNPLTKSVLLESNERANDNLNRDLQDQVLVEPQSPSLLFQEKEKPVARKPKLVKTPSFLRPTQSSIGKERTSSPRSGQKSLIRSNSRSLRTTGSSTKNLLSNAKGEKEKRNQSISSTHSSDDLPNNQTIAVPDEMNTMPVVIPIDLTVRKEVRAKPSTGEGEDNNIVPKDRRDSMMFEGAVVQEDIKMSKSQDVRTEEDPAAMDMEEVYNSTSAQGSPNGSIIVVEETKKDENDITPFTSSEEMEAQDEDQKKTENDVADSAHISIVDKPEVATEEPKEASSHPKPREPRAVQRVLMAMSPSVIDIAPISKKKSVAVYANLIEPQETEEDDEDIDVQTSNLFSVMDSLDSDEDSMDDNDFETVEDIADDFQKSLITQLLEKQREQRLLKNELSDLRQVFNERKLVEARSRSSLQEELNAATEVIERQQSNVKAEDDLSAMEIQEGNIGELFKVEQAPFLPPSIESVSHVAPDMTIEKDTETELGDLLPVELDGNEVRFGQAESDYFAMEEREAEEDEAKSEGVEEERLEEDEIADDESRLEQEHPEADSMEEREDAVDEMNLAKEQSLDEEEQMVEEEQMYQTKEKEKEKGEEGGKEGKVEEMEEGYRAYDVDADAEEQDQVMEERQAEDQKDRMMEEGKADEEEHMTEEKKVVDITLHESMDAPSNEEQVRDEIGHTEDVAQGSDCEDDTSVEEYHHNCHPQDDSPGSQKHTESNVKEQWNLGAKRQESRTSRKTQHSPAAISSTGKFGELELEFQNSTDLDSEISDESHFEMIPLHRTPLAPKKNPFGFHQIPAEISSIEDKVASSIVELDHELPEEAETEEVQQVTSMPGYKPVDEVSGDEHSDDEQDAVQPSKVNDLLIEPDNGVGSKSIEVGIDNFETTNDHANENTDANTNEEARDDSQPSVPFEDTIAIEEANFDEPEEVDVREDGATKDVDEENINEIPISTDPVEQEQGREQLHNQPQSQPQGEEHEREGSSTAIEISPIDTPPEPKRAVLSPFAKATPLSSSPFSKQMDTSARVLNFEVKPRSSNKDTTEALALSPSASDNKQDLSLSSRFGLTPTKLPFNESMEETTSDAIPRIRISGESDTDRNTTDTGSIPVLQSPFTSVQPTVIIGSLALPVSTQDDPNSKPREFQYEYDKKVLSQVSKQDLVLVNFMRKGTFVIKYQFHGKSLKSQMRILKLDSQCTYLTSERTSGLIKRKSKKVFLSEVQWIVFGRNRRLLKAKTKKALNDVAERHEWRCFSLVLRDRTVDFATLNEMDCIQWVLGLQQFVHENIVANNKPLYTRGQLLWKKTIMLLHMRADDNDQTLGSLFRSAVDTTIAHMKEERDCKRKTNGKRKMNGKSKNKTCCRNAQSKQLNMTSMKNQYQLQIS